MNATATSVVRGHSRALIVTTLGTLALLALWFIGKRALPYLEFSPDHYGPYFWPRRGWLALHIAGGITALLAGVAQLWLGLTDRIARLHRTLGKVYVGAILMGSIAGFYLALTIPGNVTYAAGLLFLCVAWVLTTSMGVLAIRRRDVLQHREWMMRSYAVTFAFVTFRIGVETLNAQGLAPADAPALMAWASWAVPLLLLEPLIQLRRARG